MLLGSPVIGIKPGINSSRMSVFFLHLSSVLIVILVENVAVSLRIIRLGYSCQKVEIRI